MRPITETDSMDRMYEILMDEVLTFGHQANPRGLACHELRPHCFRLYWPQLGLYRGITRRLNYRFFAVETLQYIAGWGDKPEHAELLIASNGNMSRFLNLESGMFDGAYGPRLKEGLQYVYETLSRDPDSRQAVACIWEPGARPASWDIPCTVALQFMQDWNSMDETPHLGLLVNMRSNDINWGMPYDVAAFCALQCAMAGCLGWQVGNYNHIAGSLHAYDKKMPMIKPHLGESHTHVRLPDLQHRLAGCHRRVKWQDVRLAAHELLVQLHEHVCQNQEPFHTFWTAHDDYLKYGDNRDATRWALYWSEWGDLIRWRWCDYE